MNSVDDIKLEETNIPILNGCLKSVTQNGHGQINGSKQWPIQSSKILENGCSSENNNGYSHEKLESILPVQISNRLIDNDNGQSQQLKPSPTNTKLIFYELIGDILRKQLELCDPAMPTDTNRVFPSLKDSQKRPYMLQISMFPLVYPTVYFTSEEDILSDVPQEVKPFLRWKLTTITANTMKAIVFRSGYKFMAVDRNSKSKTVNNWNAIWCKHLKVSEFSSIGYFQRVNHFPGSFNFGRKDRLWINLKAKADKHGPEIFASFHPPTFIIPQDYSSLLAYWKSTDSIINNGGQPLINEQNEYQNQKLFICKPPASARGQGIDIVSSIEDLHVLMQKNSKPRNANGRKTKVSMVVQEYISNPCLLYNDAKFDLRVYVLITSVAPLRLYVYKEGLVRFAANRYSKNIDNIKNQFIHLTNYSVNKNCVEYVPSNNADGQDGHKWTLKTLWRYLSMSGKVDVDQIWEQINDLIIKTVISAESNIHSLMNEHLKNKRSCFELLGFDIMMDENFKLWLLEVNITPSLRADSVLDFSVKNELIQDILNTLGYQLSSRFRRHFNFGQFLCPEKSDFLTQMKTPDEDKHKNYTTLYQTSGFEACKNLISDLTDDDVFHLMEAEDELNRCGKFSRIFPSINSIFYLKYFDSPSYYDLLLIGWEQKFHNCREEAIQRLRIILLKHDAVRENMEKIKLQLIEIDRTVSSLKS